MNRRIAISLTCLAALLLAGCGKETESSFSGSPGLYFHKQARRGAADFQNDSIAYTFFTRESQVVRDTVYIDLRAMGFPAAEARRISLVQVGADRQDAAVAGEHYVAFDRLDERLMMFPAGEVRYRLPVVVLKTPEMKQREYRLELELRDSGDFTISMKERARFLVKITDMATKPTNWDSKWVKYFGAWGSVKMKFLIDYMGITDFDSNADFDLETGKYLSARANELLDKYNKDNDTTLTEQDEAKTVVKFPK
jgi:hypothetical protein